MRALPAVPSPAAKHESLSALLQLLIRGKPCLSERVFLVVRAASSRAHFLCLVSSGQRRRSHLGLGHSSSFSFAIYR